MNKLRQEEKTELVGQNEDDNFIFTVIKTVTEKLAKEFPQYSHDFILDALESSSMDIAKAYRHLQNPTEKKDYVFNQVEDGIILELKGCQEYEILVNRKGEENVNEREDFLLG